LAAPSAILTSVSRRASSAASRCAIASAAGGQCREADCHRRAGAVRASGPVTRGGGGSTRFASVLARRACDWRATLQNVTKVQAAGSGGDSRVESVRGA
jgi:hypothetical protein